MARKLWIIDKSESVTDDVIKQVQLAGCSEIARGVPPVLQDKLQDPKLPLMYEEPEPVNPESPVDLITEIDNLKTRMLELESTVNDTAVK